jgi:hypothetical protein
MVQGNHFSKLSAFVAVAEHGAAPQKRCSIRPVAQPGPTEDQMISPRPRSAPTRPDLSLVSSHQSVQNLRKRQLVHIVHDSARDDVAAAPSNPPPRAPAPPDEMPVRSLCPRMVCTACGLVGADVRPDWSPHTNRRPTSTRSRAVDCLPRGRDDRRPVCSGHPRPRPSPQHGRNPDRAFVHSLWGRGMCAWPGGAGRRAERTDDATIHSDARSGAGIGHKTADQ